MYSHENRRKFSRQESSMTPSEYKVVVTPNNTLVDTPSVLAKDAYDAPSFFKNDQAVITNAINQDRANASDDLSEKLIQEYQTVQQNIAEITGLRIDAVPYITKLPADIGGRYTSADHSIYLAENIEHANRARRLGTLAHELAHAGSRNTRKTIRIYSGNGGVLYSLSGSQRLKISRQDNGRWEHTKNGDFFEEAFAEEASARNLEKMLPQYEKYGSILVDLNDRVSLPRRFVKTAQHPDANDKDFRSINHEYATSAIAAFGLNILSESTSQDIFEMLRDARVPDTEAVATRALIRAINSVHPRLYAYLRTRSYNLQDFTNGLEAIKKVVS